MSTTRIMTTFRLRGGGRSRGAGEWSAVDRVCLAIIVVLVLAAVFAPLIMPADPDAIDPLHPSAATSFSHLLGTDELGRDTLSRLLDAARVSLLGPAVVTLIAALAGSVLGILAGWRGGWVDQVISSIGNAAFAFPGLLLAILATAIFGKGLTTPVIALGVVYTPYVLRVSRAAVMRERRLPYIQALEAQGFSSISICGRHILPSILPLIIAQGTLGFGYAMVDLAAISYLGLGIQPPNADWGSLVATGQNLLLDGHPGQALYPGVAIVLVVVAVTLLGERMAARGEARR